MPERDPTLRIRVAAGIGLAVAGVVFFLVAAVVSDEGLTSSSLRQGSVIALLFASPCLAALAAPTNRQSVFSLAGGMMVAGAVITPGGNPLGWPLIAVGFLLLLAAVGPLAGFWILAVRTLATALVLIVAFNLSYPDSILAFLGALILVNLLAVSGRWKFSLRRSVIGA